MMRSNATLNLHNATKVSVSLPNKFISIERFWTELDITFDDGDTLKVCLYHNDETLPVIFETPPEDPPQE